MNKVVHKMMGIEITEELQGWVETVKGLGNQDTNDKNLLEGVQDIMLPLFENDMIDSDEYEKICLEIVQVFKQAKVLIEVA